MEYVGGQNQSLILICRESFLCRYPYSKMIDSYASFPMLARVHPSVFSKASDAINLDSNITLQVSGLPGYSSKEVSLSFSHMARNIRNIRNSRNALFLPFRLLHYRSYAEHSANSGDCWFSSEGGAAPSDIPRFAGRNQYDIAGTKVRSEASS